MSLCAFAGLLASVFYFYQLSFFDLNDTFVSYLLFVLAQDTLRVLVCIWLTLISLELKGDSKLLFASSPFYWWLSLS